MRIRDWWSNLLLVCGVVLFFTTKVIIRLGGEPKLHEWATYVIVLIFWIFSYFIGCYKKDEK